MSAKSCFRGSLGDQIVEKEIEVARFVPVTFNDEKTGLFSNNTEYAIIICEASGEPRPELNVYDYNHSDLSERGGYQVIVQF